jgi:hypothetical protein
MFLTGLLAVATILIVIVVWFGIDQYRAHHH